jgi:hypothetical protein
MSQHGAVLLPPSGLKACCHLWFKKMMMMNFKNQEGKYLIAEMLDGYHYEGKILGSNDHVVTIMDRKDRTDRGIVISHIISYMIREVEP